jgi:hypothetical protein
MQQIELGPGQVHLGTGQLDAAGARVQDKSGAELARETQTSDAVKKAMGRKVASN